MSKDNKICKRCSGRIDEKKERYVHVEDWNQKKLEIESWWHLNCFTKSMNRDLSLLEKQAGVMLKKVSTVYDNLPEELKMQRTILS